MIGAVPLSTFSKPSSVLSSCSTCTFKLVVQYEGWHVKSQEIEGEDAFREVIEKESGEDAAFRSGKLSYADSLSETDIGDGEAEAITTVSSTDTPIWESMQGV